MNYLKNLFLIAAALCALAPFASAQVSSTSAVYVARQAADQAVTSSTTLVDSDNLKVNVAANKKYYYRVFAPFALAGVVSGYKFQLTLPSGIAHVIQDDQVLNGITSTVVLVRVDVTVTIISGALASSGDHVLLIEGSFENGVNAGDVKLQFAQNTSDGSAITLKKGAVLFVSPVN